MKTFFKMFFAALAAVMVGFFVTSIISVMMIGSIAGSMSSSPSFMLKDNSVLMIDLNGSLDDREIDNPFTKMMTGESSFAVSDVIESIKKAKENDRIKGIYMKCRNLSASRANLEPVRIALKDFKESGKFIVSYSDAYSQGTYYLASVADKIMLNPKGLLDFQGFGIQMQFSRGMYEKMGVKYQVFKVGTFKSAVEPYIQDKMSDANREQYSSILNDLWRSWLNNISESRNIPVETLNDYADKCLAVYQADSIVKFGMVDTLAYVTGVDEYLKNLTGTDPDAKLNLATVKNMKNVAGEKKKRSKNEIAVLYADGAIVMDDSNGSFLSGNLITANKYVNELQKLKKDKNVKAVVLRVNSPGGDAYASEQIWNAIEELKKEKPVIVSMGGVAASGGYYISCAATRIIAEPTTITGSIGIYGLIPEGEELAKKMGVTFDEVKTNKHSTFGGAAFGIPFIVSAYSRSLTEEESKMVQAHIERGYDLFITRCADGRSKTKEEIDAIGQGRVWTGKQALANGLVDKLGNLSDAIATAAEVAELDDYSTNNYPKEEDFFTKMMKGSMGGAKVRMAKFVIGDEEYKQQELIRMLKNTKFCKAEMPEHFSF